MKTETTYSNFELSYGKCKSCGQVSNEIYKNNTCVDCIEAKKFFDETMNETMNETI